jgi:aldehyde:ferredoxin oxidoreductase
MVTPLEKILYIDLTYKRISVASRPELFGKYLGGSGVASKLLLEECPQKVDPFSPKAPIIFTTGPLVGMYPCIAKSVAMFKSPLTGNLGESHAGGYLSTALRFANYGAIVIKGASETPVSLVVENKNPHVKYISSLWGLSPLQVDEALKPSNGEGTHSVLSIGRAGENLVFYSGAVVDRYHHFGRLGLGAVMGSKKLKAVYVQGTDEIPLAKSSEFKSIYDEIYHRVIETDLMKKYHNLGTSANVLELSELRALPSKNFSQPTYGEADSVSGERFAEEFLERKVSCPGCPITCVHLGGLRKTITSERERAGKEICEEIELVPYNYEPIFALGINLDISDPKGVLSLISRCEGLGIDSMMVGAVLAWATEAYEKALVTADEMMALRPKWGDVETYLQMIDNIADVRNPFYVTLARGVTAAGEKYGGKDFAVSLGKNSPAGYFTGYGFVVGTLVGARHSHLSNAGYSIDQTAMMKKVGIEQMVEHLVEEEDWLNVLHSLVCCYFSRGVYDRETVIRALAAVGIQKKEEDMMRLGKEIFHNLYRFKLREGFDPTKERVPKRLLEIESPAGHLDPKVIQDMISHYVKIRGDEGLRLGLEEKELMRLIAPK